MRKVKALGGIIGLVLLVAALAMPAAATATAAQPALDIFPRVTRSGSPVEYGGQGFAPNTVYLLQVFTQVEQTIDDAIVSDELGAFVGSITAYDVGGRTVWITTLDGAVLASASFHVIDPAISVTPGEAPSGSVFEYIGSGFAPNTTYLFVVRDDFGDTTINETVATDRYGNFTGTITAYAVGGRTIDVLSAGQGLLMASTTFSVTP